MFHRANVAFPEVVPTTVSVRSEGIGEEERTGGEVVGVFIRRRWSRECELFREGATVVEWWVGRSDTGRRDGIESTSMFAEDKKGFGFLYPCMP